MSRLTEKKFLDNFKAIKNISPNYIASKEELMYEKLGELEDLEEQIGCPLEVFVKLQETHHIYAEKDGYIPVILTKNGFWWYLVYDSEYTDIQYPLSEYGKTFWLKEDKSE